MPYMILNRNYVLPSLAGRVITFEKNKPTWVPPEVVKEALGIGAEGVEDKINILEDDTPKEPLMTQADREVLIESAFDTVTGRQERGDFTGQGVPNLGVVGNLVGFQVSRGEVDPLWTAYKAKVEAKRVAAEEAATEAAAEAAKTGE